MIKVAAIDHNGPYLSHAAREIIEGMGGVEIRVSMTEQEFEEQHGSIKDYDVVLLHPGIRMQEKYLREFPLKYPDKKIAIVIDAPGDYHIPDEIPIFSWHNYEGLYEFMTGKIAPTKRGE